MKVLCWVGFSADILPNTNLQYKDLSKFWEVVQMLIIFKSTMSFCHPLEQLMMKCEISDCRYKLFSLLMST